MKMWSSSSAAAATLWLTLVGIIFPSLMALVQFETFGPFFIVVGTLAAVQLSASNFLEPRLMGKSLNLSPLAIFLKPLGGSSQGGRHGNFRRLWSTD